MMPRMEGKQLEQLLEELLEKTVGHKIPPEEKAMIVNIAKEMINDSEGPFPNGLFKGNLKNDDVKEKLGETLKAATGVALYISAQRKDLTNTLDEYEKLVKDLKKLDPKNPAQKEEYAEKLEKLEELKLKLTGIIGSLNSLDRDSFRKEHIDNKKLEVADELLALRTLVQEKKAEKGVDKLTEQDNTLTESLRNLFGMDPAVGGGTVSPVMCVIGNEFGIVDSYPAFNSEEPIHALSGNYPNLAIKAKELNDYVSLPEEISKVMDQVLDENPQLTSTAPRNEPK